MIREATGEDWPLLWPIFQPFDEAGYTYAYDPATTYEQGRVLWLDKSRQTFLFEDAGEVLGTYYIKTNQDGPCDHVCKCGYMVPDQARGRGIARQMCEHSQIIAQEMGYRAMQFNFVASSNVGAVVLWQKLGFDTVGRLPGAFKHPSKGYLDALVMYKSLNSINKGVLNV